MWYMNYSSVLHEEVLDYWIYQFKVLDLFFIEFKVLDLFLKVLDLPNAVRFFFTSLVITVSHPEGCTLFSRVSLVLSCFCLGLVWYQNSLRSIRKSKPCLA